MAKISRLYDNPTEAYEVVQALKEANVPDSDISLVSTADGVGATGEGGSALTGAGAGAAIGGGAGLLAGLGAMAIPGLGPFVAAGWLASTLAGAVAGGVTGAAAGGVLDALAAEGIDENEAHVYAETLKRGGAMLVVRADPLHTADVEAVLDRHESVGLPERAAAYESEGWRGYDDTRAYSPRAMRDRISREGLGPMI